jgi:hypothetical protein
LWFPDNSSPFCCIQGFVKDKHSILVDFRAESNLCATDRKQGHYPHPARTEKEGIMARASTSPLHVCTTCGKSTTRKGHLCSPAKAEDLSLAACEFCGKTASDPRHVCFPKRLELKYFCDSCGRLATTRSLLCRPKAIPKPKAAPKKKAAGGARTRKAAPKRKAAAKAKPRKTTKKKVAKKKR